MQPSIDELITYPLELKRIEIFSKISTKISFLLLLVPTYIGASVALAVIVPELKIDGLNSTFFTESIAIGSLTI